IPAHRPGSRQLQSDSLLSPPDYQTKESQRIGDVDEVVRFAQADLLAEDIHAQAAAGLDDDDGNQQAADQIIPRAAKLTPREFAFAQFSPGGREPTANGASASKPFGQDQTENNQQPIVALR